MSYEGSFGGFLRGVRDRHWQDHAATKGMYEGTGAAGGYTVPVDFSRALMKTFEARSIIYKRAQKVPMSSQTTLCPVVNATTAQSAGTAPYFGGMLFSWGWQTVPPTTTPAETDPTFRQIMLSAWDLIGNTTVSNQLLRDAGPEMDRYFAKLFGAATNWYAEYGFFNGTGASTKMPLGVINAPSTKVVTRSGAGLIANADINGMAAALLPYAWENAIWVCSPTTLVKIIAQSTYFVNAPGYGSDGKAYVGRLVSRPLFVSDKLPALGTKGDLILMDPSMYVVGVRQEVVVDSSPHPLFQSNQTVFRTWLRMDGRPILDGLVTLPDATTTCGSQVVLST